MSKIKFDSIEKFHQTLTKDATLKCQDISLIEIVIEFGNASAVNKDLEQPTTCENLVLKNLTLDCNKDQLLLNCKILDHAYKLEIDWANDIHPQISNFICAENISAKHNKKKSTLKIKCPFLVCN